MRIRLRAKSKTTEFRDGTTEDGLGETTAQKSQAPDILTEAVSHRRFLKMLGVAAGVAGLASVGQLAAPPRSAEAGYYSGITYDVTSTHLKVGGRLSFMGEWLTYNAYWDGYSTWVRGTGSSRPGGFYFTQGQIRYVQDRADTGTPNWQTAWVTDNNGNMGIGTTTPSRILDVAGGGVALDNGDFSVNKGIRFRNTADTSAPNGAGVYEANDNKLYIEAGSANAIVFRATGAGAPLVTFDTGTQRVGVGTTTPAGKLDVAGEIYVNGVLAISADGIAQHTQYAP